MRFQIVNTPVHQTSSVEDAVAAVDHVIVERNDHQRGISDDASELAGIERAELDGLPRAKRAQAGKHILRAENW
jgi:hypothetical protein